MIEPYGIADRIKNETTRAQAINDAGDLLMHICLTYGTSSATAYLVAGTFMRALEESYREKPEETAPKSTRKLPEGFKYPRVKCDVCDKEMGSNTLIKHLKRYHPKSEE